MVRLTPEQQAVIQAEAPDLIATFARMTRGDYRCRLFRDGRFVVAESGPDPMRAFRRANGRVPRRAAA